MLELIKVKTHAVTVELYKFVQMTRFYNMKFFFRDPTTYT